MFSLLRKLTGVTQGYVKVNVLPVKVNSSLLKVSGCVQIFFFCLRSVVMLQDLEKI